MATKKSSKVSSKNSTKKLPTKQTTAISRKRKVPKYASFRLAKKIPHPAGPLPSGYKIFKKSLQLIRQNAKVLLGILAVYALLNLVLVRGFSSPLNIGDLKESIKATFGDSVSGASLTSIIFGSLLGSGSSNSETAGLYQTILFLVVSLACIWVFRQSNAQKNPTIKGAFYESMYPLVPFLLVFVVILLQMIPAYVGTFVYGIVSSSGLAVTIAEQAIWVILTALLVLLSFYMVLSSLFALYVVTLPNMLPMQALRSARQLVFSRRLSIARKIVIIPIVALVVLILLVVPAIYFLPIAAPWLYFALSLISVIWLHAYMFSLYKELL